MPEILDEIVALIDARQWGAGFVVELMLEYVTERGLRDGLLEHLRKTAKREDASGTGKVPPGTGFEHDEYAYVWTVAGPAKARMFFGVGPDCEVKLIKNKPETPEEIRKYKPEAKLYGVKAHRAVSNTAAIAHTEGPQSTKGARK